MEYIYWEEGGNTDLACTLVQILTLWAWTYTRKILQEKEKKERKPISDSFRILMLYGPSLLNALLIRVS